MTADDGALFAMAQRRRSLNALAEAPHPELAEPETDALVGKCVDDAAAIESRMVECPAVTFPGAVLKLRIAREIAPRSIDTRSVGGRLELSALADLDRLAQESAA